jgi:hypothetical protein
MLHPYSPLPGQLRVHPIAYGGPEEEIVFLPSTPTSEPLASGSGFDPSAWIPVAGGLFQLIGGAVKSWQSNRNANNQQQVVYTPPPAPSSNAGLWLGVAAVGLVAAAGLGIWAFKE